MMSQADGGGKDKAGGGVDSLAPLADIEKDSFSF
jgi:hypothetical protein